MPSGGRTLRGLISNNALLISRLVKEDVDFIGLKVS